MCFFRESVGKLVLTLCVLVRSIWPWTCDKSRTRFTTELGECFDSNVGIVLLVWSFLIPPDFFLHISMLSIFLYLFHYLLSSLCILILS